MKRGIVSYSLPFLVLHNSLRGSHSLSSSAYIVSISILGMVTRSISITINTDSAQVNGTGLGGERTPLLNHPKKNMCFSTSFDTIHSWLIMML